MIEILLKIKAFKYEIYKPFYSISARDKINSVQIYETNFLMDRILNDLTLGELGRFLLNMFTLYGSEFTVNNSSEYYNGSVLQSIYFSSKPIEVSVHNIAGSLPHKIRSKYFILDPMQGRWKVNPDLYFNEGIYDESYGKSL